MNNFERKIQGRPYRTTYEIKTMYHRGRTHLPAQAHCLYITLRRQVTGDKFIDIDVMINIYGKIARYVFHTNRLPVLLPFSITTQETSRVSISTTGYGSRFTLQLTGIRQRRQQDCAAQR